MGTYKKKEITSPKNGKEIPSERKKDFTSRVDT